MLYLGEYDITDLNKLVLSLFAPNNAKLSGVELVADYTLQSPPENWKQADVLPSEDSNATVCYVEETLVQISGGIEAWKRMQDGQASEDGFCLP